jgi:hypothetical protein
MKDDFEPKHHIQDQPYPNVTFVDGPPGVGGKWVAVRQLDAATLFFDPYTEKWAVHNPTNRTFEAFKERTEACGAMLTAFDQNRDGFRVVAIRSNGETRGFDTSLQADLWLDEEFKL